MPDPADVDLLAETDPLGNRRILIIDDNPSIHDDYRKILAPVATATDLADLEAELFGTQASATAPRPDFTLTDAMQGQDGHRLVVEAKQAEQPFALAFIDMRMPPGWDGMLTATRILAADPDIQVVICTAYSDYSWDDLAQKLGATDRVLILKKPFDNVEVMQLAMALCRKWSLSRLVRSRMEILESLVQKRVHELAASNVRLSTLIQVSPVGIFVLDKEGRVASWNPAAERIFGWAAEEVIGRLLPSSMPSHLRVLMRAGAEPPLTDERQGTDLHVKRKDGVGIEVATYTAQVTSQDGVPDGYIVVVADITARKQIEDELRRAKIAAEAAAHAKSDFLATMSHEIRTPMNGVMGMAELLLTTQLDAEQRDFTQTIYQSGEALLAIINDILDFSKIEAGMLSLDPIPFDLRTAVSSVVELLASRAEAKGIELIYRCAPDLPSAVIGDAGRIRQVLTNLVGNAVKFTLQGHVFVEVMPREIGNGRPGIRMAVHDTGIGIPADKQRLLFQKFTQADSSTTRQFGGTGLGLAISKQLAELMGGQITVESVSGQGSTFIVDLPLVSDHHPTSMRLPVIDLADLRVVIAEANPIAMRVMEEQLRSWQCLPVPVSSADEAISAVGAAVAQAQAVICIIDARLPHTDPFAFARQLRARVELAAVPLILLTSIGQRGDSKKATEAGFNAYLTKPVQMSDLRDALASLRATPVGGSDQLVTRHSLAEARGHTSSGSRRRTAVQMVANRPVAPRILVAEDSPVNSQIVKRTLEHLGCEVLIAVTGGEAVAMCLGGNFDLVLMDYHLPEMDGVIATRLIRNRERDRRTPILAMSASVMDQDRVLFQEAGMDGFLAKPMRLDELKTAVARWTAPGLPAPADNRR